MASIASISGSQPATAATFAPAQTAATGAPGAPTQVDFLKLLMAQMQNQNPMNPTSGTDYVTQMAQFSTVQGITQMNQNISSMLAMQGLNQSVGLIGKTVAYTDASGRTASGPVTAVAMVGGQPQLVINNTAVGISQIQVVQASARKQSAAATASS
jgi:flagellar basal-body rod modification protein FlgD